MNISKYISSAHNYVKTIFSQLSYSYIDNYIINATITTFASDRRIKLWLLCLHNALIMINIQQLSWINPTYNLRNIRHKHEGRN